MTILNEEKTKEKRKLNVIIHGVQESKSEAPLKRKSEDIDHANTLLQKHLGVDVKVENAITLGKKSDDKPCLLRITTPSETVKKQIMRSATKLQNQTNPDWVKRVFITPDLTPKEQEANRALRQN